MILAQFEAELLGRGFEHAHALGHDLLADAVAGDDGDVVDAVGGHGRGSSEYVPIVTIVARKGWRGTRHARDGPAHNTATA